MALTRVMLEILLDEAQRRPFSGALLALGRQQVLLSDAALADVIRARFDLNDAAVAAEIRELHVSAADGGLDRAIFRRLGFSEVASLDISPYEGADILGDLNDPALGAAWAERFDVVADLGTLEHIFDLPRGLANIVQMLRVGGRVIHCSPWWGHLNHGYYMMSPVLYDDYYRANAFEINRLQVCRYRPRGGGDAVELLPTLTPQHETGDGAAWLYGVICAATKTAPSSGRRAPQQTPFRLRWEASRAAGEAHAR